MVSSGLLVLLQTPGGVEPDIYLLVCSERGMLQLHFEIVASAGMHVATEVVASARA